MQQNMSFTQYLKDTRSELNHVAWPTKTQTMIFTALVISLSVLVSLYLGLFDYVFTNALGRGLELLPGQQGAVQLDPAAIEQALQNASNTPAEVPLTEQAPLNLQ